MLILKTNNLTRDLILLARLLRKRGVDAQIAAPGSKKEIYLMNVPFIRQNCFLNYFNRGGHANSYRKPKADKAAIVDADSFDIGIDLSLWNPNSVPVLRQNRFLIEYNVAPHQKLITIISPLGENLSVLLESLGRVSGDFVIGLMGSASRTRNKRIIRQAQGHNLVFIGNSTDEPTLIRASFAVMSLTPDAGRMMKFAIAMGRPTIWPKEAPIKPNIALGTDMAAALQAALDLPRDKRVAFERKNLSAAKKFDIENTIKAILSKQKIS